MKAEELRIGNYLEHNKHGLINVVGVKPHCDNHMIIHDDTWCYLTNCKPIPLTEQWLIDFGFEYNPIVLISRQYLLYIGRDRLLSFSDVGTPNFMVWLQSVEGNKVTDLVCIHNWDYDKEMFVHQLQNLYFALTGEDLQL